MYKNIVAIRRVRTCTMYMKARRHPLRNWVLFCLHIECMCCTLTLHTFNMVVNKTQFRNGCRLAFMYCTKSGVHVHIISLQKLNNVYISNIQKLELCCYCHYCKVVYLFSDTLFFRDILSVLLGLPSKCHRRFECHRVNTSV